MAKLPGQAHRALEPQTSWWNWEPCLLPTLALWGKPKERRLRVQKADSPVLSQYWLGSRAAYLISPYPGFFSKAGLLYGRNELVPGNLINGHDFHHHG